MESTIAQTVAVAAIATVSLFDSPTDMAEALFPSPKPSASIEIMSDEMIEVRLTGYDRTRTIPVSLPELQDCRHETVDHSDVVDCKRALMPVTLGSGPELIEEVEAARSALNSLCLIEWANIAKPDPDLMSEACQSLLR